MVHFPARNVWLPEGRHCQLPNWFWSYMLIDLPYMEHRFKHMGEVCFLRLNYLLHPISHWYCNDPLYRHPNHILITFPNFIPLYFILWFIRCFFWINHSFFMTYRKTWIPSYKPSMVIFPSLASLATSDGHGWLFRWKRSAIRLGRPCPCWSTLRVSVDGPSPARDLSGAMWTVRWCQPQG